MGDKLFRSVIIVIVAVLLWVLLGWFITMMGVGIPSVVMSLIALLIVIVVVWYIAHNIWGFNF